MQDGAAGGGRGVPGTCNVYRPSDWNARSYGQSSFGYDPVANPNPALLDMNWPGLSRSDHKTDPGPDWLGVFVQATHDSLTGISAGNQTLSQDIHHPDRGNPEMSIRRLRVGPPNPAGARLPRRTITTVTPDLAHARGPRIAAGPRRAAARVETCRSPQSIATRFSPYAVFSRFLYSSPSKLFLLHPTTSR